MSEPNDVIVGLADDFPVGEFRIVTVGRREIGVLRRADGRVQAVRNRCPHKGAPMCKFQADRHDDPGATWHA